MTTHSDSTSKTPVRTRSTPFVLAVAGIAAVGFALAFGSAWLDVAEVAVPHQLALKTAQLGFVAPTAQAAPIGSETGYLPAQLAAQGDAEEPHPPSF
jgi:hypothetical protein